MRARRQRREDEEVEEEGTEKGRQGIEKELERRWADEKTFGSGEDSRMRKRGRQDKKLEKDGD